ncbi:polysaccharide biosynthesis protein [Vreelandella populi]|uniref:Polysaccharide biosynthesis protein n=1 Tax=Vreelandella populi TaxID=2498858 RepID=A0A3S0YKS3_9GAMM|nr:nucleoside-diphosphate sugar epimerase/dehydratase [Halomonas populi]RUR35581.1 polysaccharide biosynthesis protein [Halomonas populi]RUR47771.1 polysaccharide biosynthesis protein [Halomonas populi]
MMFVIEALFGLTRRRKQLIQLIVDTFLIVASFFLAMLLRLDSLEFLTDKSVWLALPVMIPVSLFIFIRLGFYRSIVRFMGMKALQALLAGAFGSALTLYVVSMALNLPVPRSVPFIYTMLAFITIGGIRLALRLMYQRGQQLQKTRVLIYGAGAAGRQLVVSLRHGRDYEPVGFVDYAPLLQGTHVQGLRVYSPESTPTLIENFGVEKFLLAIPEATRARRQEIIESIEPLSIPVQTIPDMADIISGKAKFNELRDVRVEDLLGRDPVPPDPKLMGANITHKSVMVTGAGGSIGSELCRQIVRLHPERLIIVDSSEYSLYQIDQDLAQIINKENLNVEVKPALASVRNGDVISRLMRTFETDTIYHAAAYKHVPLVEFNPAEGVLNNVFGTMEVAKAAIKEGVESFVLVSTDKAVRPTNVMGASKRMAELICQACADEQTNTRFSMVRFGNVLGSSGSVVPLFRKQIEKGGPITVTHPDITRYFMTIPEAAQLVIQASGMATGGDVFVLDMGKPVKIVELAIRMVKLSGLNFRFMSVPSDAKTVPAQESEKIVEKKGEISIRFTGLRPGEKLYEELLATDSAEKTRHPRIMTASEDFLPWSVLEPMLSELEVACKTQDAARIRELLIAAPTAYQPQSDIVDHFWMSTATQHTISKSPMNTAVASGDVSERYEKNNESQSMKSSSLENSRVIPEVSFVIDSVHSKQN